MTFEIRLLGPLELCRDGTPVPLPATHKAQSLLAYLVTTRGRPQPRDKLAGLFWPDRPDPRARRSLATALWRIRRCLLADCLLVDTQTVQFDPQADFWLDVAQFETQISRQGFAPLSTRLSELSAAVELYRGDFLEGFYDDWCLEERYRLESLYLGALEWLATAYERDQPHEALRCARLLLARDPLREDVQQLAIRLLVRLGDRAEALRQAQRCRTALWAELGVKPAPETTALCDELLGPAWRAPASAGPDAPRRGRSSFDLERLPFVGREGELHDLLAHWAQATQGAGHLVLLCGEAGVGKSRLVEEFGQHVRRRRGRVVPGQCYEYERLFPYGPLVDLLRALLADLTAEERQRLPAWQVLELARLAPELAGPRPAPAELPPVSSQADQAHLFDALTRFLLDQANRAPLLLTLDDLHWAADSTLAWLHYQVRHLAQAPILVVGTCRSEQVSPTHPLYGLITQLTRAGLAARLDLERLSLEAVAQWVGEMAVDPAQLYRQTEGNPFFVLETLRALCETDAAAPIPIPASVRSVVEARVARLPASAQEVLTVAAVAGREFDFDVVQRAWGQGEETALEALDALLRRQLVREGRGLAGRDYAFDHHLVREVTYQGLHYRRRRRLHRLVGEALESLPARTAGELAHHFERARDAERALRYLVEAGEQAQHSYATPDALAYYRRALALLDPGRDDRLAARLLSGLAAAHRDVVGDEAPAWSWLRRALAIWEALDESVMVAETCYALAYEPADFDQARACVQRGLHAVEGTAGPDAQRQVARGYGLLARFHEHEGDFGLARQWAVRYLELSQALDDRRELVQAHHRLGSLLLRAGGPVRQALAHEQQAAAIADELGCRDLAAGSHNVAGYCLLALGRTAEAEATIQRALRISQEIGVPWRQCWAYHYLALVALRRGAWAEAETWLDQAQATMAHQSTHFQEIVLLRARGRLASRRGDPATALALFAQTLALCQEYYPRYVPAAELELASVHVQQGEWELARGRLDRALAVAQEKDMRDELARAARLQGEILAAKGRWDEAARSFEESRCRYHELELVVEGARTEAVYGRLLLAHGEPARGRALLESVLTTLTAAAAQPEVAEIRQVLAAAQGTPRGMKMPL